MDNGPFISKRFCLARGVEVLWVIQGPLDAHGGLARLRPPIDDGLCGLTLMCSAETGITKDSRVAEVKHSTGKALEWA